MADELIEDGQDAAMDTAGTPAEIAVAVADESPAVAGDPDAETPAATEAPAAPVNENFKWYIIHAYSGFER